MKTPTGFSPEELEMDFMGQELETLMTKVRKMPPEASVDAIRTWSKIIRAGLETEVWKN